MRMKKTVSLSLSAAVLAGMVSLAGCNWDNNNVRPQGMKNNTAQRFNVRANDQNGNRYNDLNGLKYSSVLSRKVTEVGSVGTAHVMTTDHEAFVAVTLNGTRPDAAGAGNVTGRTSTLGRPLGQGVNPGGTDYRPRGTVGGVTGLGYDGNRAGMYGAPGTTYDGARLGGGLGVQADNFAGTGRGMNAADNVPDGVKNEIERLVKKTAPQIQQVYISADTNFVDRVGRYSTDGNGMTLGNNPVTNTVRNAGQDLGAMIEQIFPMRRGTLTGPNGNVNYPTRGDMNPNR
ncbi:YhcN/YlaJ family sporulation lipoprotein [Paenibacillus caui]|uniref:YhcN/YlaJ family sporulation lipoprotein n=1 Tax=Paenibacillus caui TaxID=2873927 RepID=UPI001CA99B63|nr:YhcN/YlaJ family sporulation lipoprotein [Paenibacillus caui]